MRQVAGRGAEADGGDGFAEDQAVAFGVEGAAALGGREQFHGGKAGQRAVVGQFDAEDDGFVDLAGGDQAARGVEGGKAGNAGVGETAARGPSVASIRRCAG
jgi:hypothetical protein